MTKIVGIRIGCIIRTEAPDKSVLTSYCDTCDLEKRGNCWAGDIDDLAERVDAEIIIKGPFTIFDE